jgi:hypothetical protein
VRATTTRFLPFRPGPPRTAAATGARTNAHSCGRKIREQTHFLVDGSHDCVDFRELERRTKTNRLRRTMLGGALILFGLSHTLWLSLTMIVFVGSGLMQSASASNTKREGLLNGKMPWYQLGREFQGTQTRVSVLPRLST